jgi:hypothetical protein
VVDADTGRPVFCRVSIRGEDGSWHFPEPASPEGSVVPYRKRAIGNPAIVLTRIIGPPPRRLSS